jgi:hypothetical protein
MYVELASSGSTVAEDLIHDSEVNGLSWIKLSEPESNGAESSQTK